MGPRDLGAGNPRQSATPIDFQEFDEPEPELDCSPKRTASRSPDARSSTTPRRKLWDDCQRVRDRPTDCSSRGVIVAAQSPLPGAPGQLVLTGGQITFFFRLVLRRYRLFRDGLSAALICSTAGVLLVDLLSQE